MNREIHVRFWESAGVRFPCATQHYELSITDKDCFAPIAIVNIQGLTLRTRRRTGPGRAFARTLDWRLVRSGLTVPPSRRRCWVASRPPRPNVAPQRVAM